MSSSNAKPAVMPMRLRDQPFTLVLFLWMGYGVIWLASHFVWYGLTIEHALSQEAVFHSAVLRCADGGVIPLKLTDRGEPANQPVGFFQNASQWIVHVTVDVPISAGPAELDLDVTVVSSGKAIREQVTLRLIPVVTRSSGFAFASA